MILVDHVDHHKIYSDIPTEKMLTKDVILGMEKQDNYELGIFSNVSGEKLFNSRKKCDPVKVLENRKNYVHFSKYKTANNYSNNTNNYNYT